jgi:N6-L-threonylcarbamoyladenine synthase
VNHLEGHIYAARLLDTDLQPPIVALLVSGGHTMLVHVPRWGRYEVLGRTLDDAVGEAFDKVAKLLGLGYPGGPVISRLAAEGDPTAIPFPRAMLRSGNLDVSLSGLKTAVIQYVEAERAAGRELRVPDISASFQAAVIDVQVAKTVRAAEERSVNAVVLAGGVAANQSLRAALGSALAERGIRLSVPSFGLCTDNASMIAAVAHDHLRQGRVLGLSADAEPGMRLGE